MRAATLATLAMLVACSGGDGGGGTTAPRCTINGVTITNGASVAMTVGQTVDVQATVAQAGCATLPPIVWASSNPQAVTVSSTGTVTAVAVGSSTVTAQLQGRAEQASVTVTVTGRVLSLTLAPDSTAVLVGATTPIVATLQVDPGAPQTITWSSSDATRATVSATGVVTGVAAGTATITATPTLDPSKARTARVTVVPRVSGVTVTPPQATIPVGATLQLTATVAGDSGVATGVRWRSDTPAVATISNDGLVTALAAGTVQLTAISLADDTRRASATVTVTPRVTGIAVTPAADTLAPGGTVQLAATVTGDPGVATTVTWRTSAASVATVTAGGLVTAVAAGTATIEAVSTADTTRRASAAILVVPRVLAVTVTPTTGTLAPAATLHLTATVTGDPGIATTVSWRTSASSIATVGASGLVTAVAPGTATITAISTADTTKRATATITVSAPGVTAVSITPPSATILVGATATFTATVTRGPGVAGTVTWSSSSTAIATVSSAGVVTGVAAGSATITATSTADPTKQATATVTVIAPAVQSVTVSPATASLAVGATTTLTATVTRDAPLAGTVTWSSSSTAIATVSGTGTVTGVSAGSVTITATSTVDATKKGTATITVTAPPPIPGRPQGDLCLGMQVSGSGSIVAGRVPKRSAAAADVGAAATATCATQVDVDLLVGDEADILPYYPSQGTTTQPFTGSSSKTNVVDFISGTTLRAFGAGTATVTITSGGRTVTATITVVASAKAVCPALTPTGPCISSVSLAVGEQKTVYARTTGSAVLTPGFWVLNHPIVDPILYLVDNRIVLTGRTAGTQALLMYWTGSTIIGSPVSLQVTVTP